MVRVSSLASRFLFSGRPILSRRCSEAFARRAFWAAVARWPEATVSPEGLAEGGAVELWVEGLPVFVMFREP